LGFIHGNFGWICVIITVTIIHRINIFGLLNKTRELSFNQYIWNFYNSHRTIFTHYL